MIEGLLAGERLDDLQNGYKIIQNPEKFCFGIDAVLLADFTRARQKERILDFCTGTGIVPLLLKARNKGGEILGLEIQEDCADMAARSMAYNHVEEEIHIVQGDLKEASARFGEASFHVVTCNPPYMQDRGGLHSEDPSLRIARHEVLCTFEDIAREASRLLMPKGRMYLIHRPFRLVELFSVLSAHRLEPKRLRFVHPYVEKEPAMVLIEALKNGNPQINVDPPLIVYDRPGSYTEEIRRIYSVMGHQR